MLQRIASASALLLALVALVAPRATYAQGTPPNTPVDAAAPTAPAPAPAPYSLPWQLRPAVAGNVVRSDTTVALYKDAKSGDPGSTVASMLLFSYKITPELAPLLRLGVVSSSPPSGDGATNIVNPALGLTYGIKLGSSIRLAAFLGMTLPIGMGGGDSAEPAKAAASRSGILARSAMDNAMFAVNDLTLFPGLDIAYVDHKLTVQAEATVLQLMRARGNKAQKDGAKTNLTTGLHVGYFFLPMLSAGGEIRYQRWLTTPAAVAADATGTLRDTATFAVGLRYHQKLGQSVWIRPGLAYARGIDKPMADQGYNIVQVDIPVAF